jgi:hypothetical protein
MQQVRFQLDQSVSLDEAAMTLNLAKLAAEGLVAPALVRLHVQGEVDRDMHALVVSGSGKAFDVVVRVFTALLTREFGETAFSTQTMFLGMPSSTLPTNLAAQP